MFKELNSKCTELDSFQVIYADSLLGQGGKTLNMALFTSHRSKLCTSDV